MEWNEGYPFVSFTFATARCAHGVQVSQHFRGSGCTGFRKSQTKYKFSRFHNFRHAEARLLSQVDSGLSELPVLNNVNGH